MALYKGENDGKELGEKLIILFEKRSINGVGDMAWDGNDLTVLGLSHMVYTKVYLNVLGKPRTHDMTDIRDAATGGIE